MRFIRLGKERADMLARIYKHSKYHRVRQRAHCIMLSNDGYTISDLKKIFNADLTTIYNWFNEWESKSLVGLYDRKGKGRKPKLSPEMKEQIREWAKKYSESRICELIEKKFGVSVSTKTVQRVLKAFKKT